MLNCQNKYVAENANNGVPLSPVVPRLPFRPLGPFGPWLPLGPIWPLGPVIKKKDKLQRYERINEDRYLCTAKESITLMSMSANCGLISILAKSKIQLPNFEKKYSHL